MESLDKFIQENRNYYYKKYPYKAVLIIDGVSFIRYFRGKSPEDYLDIQNFTRKQFGVYSKSIYKDTDFDKLRELAKFLHDEKLFNRVENNFISIFSLDESILNKNLERFGLTQYFKALNYQGVKFFKQKPNFKYRVYLKSGYYPSNQFKDFINYLSHSLSTNHINISRCLLSPKKLPYGDTFLHNSYYIDYNDESFNTFIKLVYPEFVSNNIFKLDCIDNKDKYN